LERRVLVIVGPTCSGKTKLSIEVASLLNTEIISADSRQLYKFLNIGTAKPDIHQREMIRHYFVDILNPDTEYDVAKFSSNAEKIIQSILAKNKIPIISGGSGLYVQAIIDGISLTADRDEKMRKELLEKRRKYGNEFLYVELQKVDKVSANSMLPQNWKRVIRALEVVYSTGKPVWQHHLETNKELKFEFKQFGLLWDRETLYKNIENRVDEIIESGLVEEVKTILRLGYKEELNSLNTVGYKEIISFLKNEITMEKSIELIKRNTRRYAKRQLTWFKRDKRIKWLLMDEKTDFHQVALEIISTLN
jgi:tRNA dimethylallyltransferase